jgi:hypothetical protein
MAKSGGSMHPGESHRLHPSQKPSFPVLAKSQEVPLLLGFFDLCSSIPFSSAYGRAMGSGGMR